MRRILEERESFEGKSPEDKSDHRPVDITMEEICRHNTPQSYKSYNFWLSLLYFVLALLCAFQCSRIVYYRCEERERGRGRGERELRRRRKARAHEREERGRR